MEKRLFLKSVQITYILNFEAVKYRHAALENIFVYFPKAQKYIEESANNATGRKNGEKKK